MPREVSPFFSGALRRRKLIPKPEKVLTVFMQRCQMSNVLGEVDGYSFISAIFHLLKKQGIWPKGRSAIPCLIDICSQTTEKCFYLPCATITVCQKAKKALNYTWLVAGFWYFNAMCSILASFFVSSFHFKRCHLGRSTAKSIDLCAGGTHRAHPSSSFFWKKSCRTRRSKWPFQLSPIASGGCWAFLSAPNILHSFRDLPSHSHC